MAQAIVIAALGEQVSLMTAEASGSGGSQAVLIESSDSEGEATGCLRASPALVAGQVVKRDPISARGIARPSESTRPAVKCEVAALGGLVKHDPSELCMREGVHVALGTQSPLQWAVLKPAAIKHDKNGRAKLEFRGSQQQGCSVTRTDEDSRSCSTTVHERVKKRLRVMQHCSPGRKLTETPGMARKLSAGSGEGLREYATVQFRQALGIESETLAAAITEAFLKEHGPTAAKPRLLSLLKALRANATLRASVLEKGLGSASTLAGQDPQEWASTELQSRRLQWSIEALKEACPTGGQVSTCPDCGGRAILQCGQSADFKKAKQYAHYTCMEERCGKVTHIKE